MKRLKYLKLFEAFESEKLTKTLGYINQESSEKLIDTLKKVCKTLDFPVSELKDSFFQYLPYQKALDLQYTAVKNPCGQTSVAEFGAGVGIAGENCQSGKIRRLWGGRIRIVDCPKCGGTGVEAEKSQVKLLKFWFTKEGEMTATTGVDSISVPSLEKINKISFNINDYNIGAPVSRTQRDELMEGDFVLAQLRSGGREIMCYVYRQRGDIYLLQNEYDGGEPSGRLWKDIAGLSWEITNWDLVSLKKTTPKVRPEVEPEIDPLSFNKEVFFNYRGMNIVNNTREEVKKNLSAAHFGLILDLDKLKQNPFKTGTEIQDERTDLRKGSLKLLKDSEIKALNIERYMQEIAQRSDIISDINKLPKVISRLMGGKNIFLLMFDDSYFTRDLSKLAKTYEQALSEEPEGNYYKRELSQFITEKYKDTSGLSQLIDTNLSYLKKYCENSTEEKYYLEILTGLEKISQNMYQKLLQKNFDCIEDIEILKVKLDSLRLLARTERYGLTNCDYLVDALVKTRPEKSLSYLIGWRISDNFLKILAGIEGVLKIVEKF